MVTHEHSRRSRVRGHGGVPSRRPFAAAIGAALLLGCSAQEAMQAQDPPGEPGAQTFRVVTVAEGLRHPWGLAFLPTGEILVTERTGDLRVIRDGRLEATPVAGVPEVWAQGQGGLLGIAVHPQYQSNQLVYLSYSKPGPRGATTAVVRGRFDGARLAEVEEIFEAEAWSRDGRHFGSRLVFDGAGYLYITVGDRGAMAEAQNLTNHQGTTIRLHDDGRVPADNPLIDEPGARPEIYTYGNRNAQGMAVHPTTGEVWQNEHGPRGGDEINIVRPGANYGWPLVTHGVDYSGAVITDQTEAEGIQPPFLHWTPSIAPSGMAFYTGDAFPRWRGNVFVGALAGMHLRRVVVDGTQVVSQEPLLTDAGYRFRDVVTGPDGYLYLLVDAVSAPVLRLEPGAR
jgi:aldose sugar dehydrogenase